MLCLNFQERIYGLKFNFICFLGECPPYWDKMSQGDTCSLITLKTTDQEYADVQTKFEASLVSSHGSVYKTAMYSGYSRQYSKIVKIERVQNIVLYAQYVARKKTMDQQNPQNINNEIELFHGCPKDVADKISHQGFNRSFAGKNGKVSNNIKFMSAVKRMWQL